MGLEWAKKKPFWHKLEHMYAPEKSGIRKKAGNNVGFIIMIKKVKKDKSEIAFYKIILYIIL